MWWSPTDRRALAPIWPALLLAAPLAGCLSGPVRTFRSTAQDAHGERDRTRSLTNLLELSEQDVLGPDFAYRVDAQVLQGVDERSAQGVEVRSESLQVRPAAELVLGTDSLRWSQRYELLDNRSQLDPGTDNHLVRTNLLEKLELVPPGWPMLTGWINRRTVEDDLFAELDTLEAQFGVQQALPALDYQYTLETQTDDDRRADVENERLEHTLRATLREEADGGRLTASLSVFGNSRDTDLHGTSAGAPGLEVFATQAFAAVDTTPEIATLPANAALIDGDDTVPTGIDIGGFASGGQEDWNIAAQLPPGSTVDGVHLSTADVLPLTFRNQFTFSAWVSDDNAFWTLVTSSAAYDYDEVLRRFRLTLPPLSARFLKVVNTASPASAPAVLVSELRLFAPAAVPGDSTRSSDDETRSATGNLSYRVTDELTVGYDLFLQRATSETEGVDLRDETRVDNGLWSTWSPHAKVDTTLRVSDQRTDDPVVQDEDVTTLTGVVAYRPLETLDVNASYTSTDRQVDGRDDLDTDAIQGLTSARLLETLRADLSLQLSRQDDATNQREIDHVVAGVTLVADLTRALELSLGWRDDDADVTGPGAGGIPDPSETRSEMVWVLKPGDRFTLQVELEWIESFAGDGLDQRTRLDWIPFADGAVGLNLDYDHRSVESSGDTEFDRYRGELRYTFTPRTFFELDLAIEDRPDEAPTRILAFAFNFSP